MMNSIIYSRITNNTSIITSPGGVVLGILGGGVPPGSLNPDPISHQN